MGCVSVKIGSQCGCLKATIVRVGVGLSATVSSIDEPLKATIVRVGANINANIGLICSTEALDEIFICTDDVFILIDGRTFNVLK